MHYCLKCGEEVTGPALRFRLGTVEYLKRGPTFQPDLFNDGVGARWAHASCLPRVLTTPLDQGWCRLCNCQFFSTGLEVESVLLVEGGDLQGDDFQAMAGGCGHFLCVSDDWDVPLEALVGEPEY